MVSFFFLVEVTNKKIIVKVDERLRVFVFVEFSSFEDYLLNMHREWYIVSRIFIV